MYDEVVSGDRLCPEISGVDVVFFRAGARCAGRLIERVDAGVALVGWARGPFPVSGVCLTVDTLLPFMVMAPFLRGPEGDVWEAAPHQPEVM